MAGPKDSWRTSSFNVSSGKAAAAVEAELRCCRLCAHTANKQAGGTWADCCAVAAVVSAAVLASLSAAASVARPLIFASASAARCSAARARCSMVAVDVAEAYIATWAGLRWLAASVGNQ